MPNDNSADLQIKPVGGTSQNQTSTSTPATSANTTASVSSSSATTSTSDSTTPVAPLPEPNAALPANISAQPTNSRAFNLEADVDEAATGTAKPEKYAIPKLVKEKYADLVELIKTTESMDDQEREYWFQIMPIMTTEQIEKFRNILLTEKQQLSDLDKEYEDELNRLNEKHLLEWKEFESKEKNKAIKQAEQADQVQEKQLEEDLLAKLSSI